MKNIIIVLLKSSLFLFSFYSCKTDKTIADNEIEEIVVAGKIPSTIQISEFTNGMKVVKLETNNDCLLGALSKIRFSTNHIYIKDLFFNGIYQFDKSGKFVQKLQKEGQGPGEYLDISDFLIDEKSKTLEILDTRNKKLIIYSLSDFSFIKAIPVSLSVAFRIAKKDNFYYFDTSGHRNIVNEQPTNSNIIVFNTTTNKYTPLFNKLLPDEEHQSWEFTTPFTINSDGEVFVSMTWQNNCYKIEKESIKPIFSINAGSHDIPEKIKQGSYSEKVDFLNSSLSKNKLMFFKLFMYEDNNIILSYLNGYNPAKIYYYIRLNEREYYTDSIQNDFIPENPALDPNVSFMEKDYFISIITPEEPISSYLDYFDVQPDDNPVILLFKVK